DPSSYADALEVVSRYRVELPARPLHHLRAGAAGLVRETPERAELPHVAGLSVILSVKDALRGSVAEAERLGYDTRVVDAALQGEARDVGARIAAEARRAHDGAKRPLALLLGGE